MTDFEKNVEKIIEGYREAIETEKKRINALFIRVYNSGYMAGHNDTVEACFVDVLDSDMDTYHEDIVTKLLLELDGDDNG